MWRSFFQALQHDPQRVANDIVGVSKLAGGEKLGKVLVAKDPAAAVSVIEDLRHSHRRRGASPSGNNPRADVRHKFRF